MIEVELPDGTVVEFPDGTSQDVMRSALQRRVAAGQTKPAPNGAGAGQMARAGALGAVDTASLGFGDEAAAGLGYLLDKLPGERGRSYDELLSTARGTQQQAQEAAPGSYLAGQIAGGIAGGVGLARGGLSLAANAAGRGAGLGRVASASAVDGAILGGASGFGSGEGMEGRTKGSVIGAVGGGVLGGAAPYTVAAGGHAMRAATAPVMARIRPEPYAQQALGDTLRRSGMTADTVVREMEAAALDGQPMFNVADALGHEGGRRMSAITRTPNDARQGVVEALQARQMGQGERLSAAMAEGFGALDTAAQRVASLTNARTSEANELYGVARQQAGAVNVSPVVEAIDAVLSPGASRMATPRDRIAYDSIEGALSRVRSMITDGRSNLTDFNALFRAKLDVDDMITRAEGQGAGNRAHYLSNIQRRIDAALAEASAPYATARDAFSTASRGIDAVGEGGMAASSRTRAPDNIERFRQLTPDEQSGFRAGYVDPQIARVEAASISPTTNKARILMTEKMAQEFPAFAAPGRGQQLGSRIGREQRMFETANAALGGSKTANNLADNADLGQFDPSIVMSLAQGRIGPAIMSAVAKALNEVSGTPPPVSNRIAKALMETSPQAARDLLEAAQRKGGASDATRGRAIAIMNALTASTAGRLAAP